MKTRHVFNFLPLRLTGIRAITLYPFIFYKYPRARITEATLRHELVHIQQIRRVGFFKFYITYVWYSIRHGYRNNPYEVEARTSAAVPLDPSR